MTDQIKKAAVPDDYLAGYDGFKKDWISTSALSTLMGCGINFYNRYVLRLPEPSTIRRSVGVAAHKGRERNLTQKVDSKVDCPLDEVTDATRDAVEREFDMNEVQVEKEFDGLSKLDAKGLAIDIGTEIATLDRTIFHPQISPTSVEKSYAVEYSGLSRTIVGKIDVNEDIDGLSVISDFKSGGKAYGQARVDSSMQISTYGLLKLATTGKLVDEYRIHNVTKGKTAAKTNFYTTTRTLPDLQQQLDRFAAWLKIADAGDFAPADPTSWKCSEDYCGYWRICKFGGNK